MAPKTLLLYGVVHQQRGKVMSFFPHDPTKYRPTKLLLRADLLREVDQAIQEGLAGYTNRHEITNDALEQLLIELRYGDGADESDQPKKQRPVQVASAVSPAVTSPKPKEDRVPLEFDSVVEAPETTSDPEPKEGQVEPIWNLAETAISVPASRGLEVKNEIAAVKDAPLYGLHNRDAPTAFALSILATQAHTEMIPMREFYDAATAQAWRLAAALEPWEREHKGKVTVMLPRNRAKPQSAADGFQFFGMGQVSKRPDENGKLACFGPFYLWRAAGLHRSENGEVLIGLTSAGWDLLDAFDGLDFSLPHDDGIARKFINYLAQHAPSDLWGFREVLETVTTDVGRLELAEHFRARLTTDFPLKKGYTDSVAESTAQGYLSRSRAWSMIEPKLDGGRYRLTDHGEAILSEIKEGKLGQSAPLAVPTEA